MLIFVERGGEADSLAPGKSLDWGTDMLVVSANRNKVIRVTVYLASEENDQIRPERVKNRVPQAKEFLIKPDFATLSLTKSPLRPMATGL